LRAHGEKTRRLERLRNAVAFQSEIDKHEATLERAALLQTESGRLSELIGQIKATDDSLSQILAAETSLAGATAALNSVATTVNLELDPDALKRVRLDGEALEGAAASRSIVAKTRIDIEGIGTISIEPQMRKMNCCRRSKQPVQGTSEPRDSPWQRGTRWNEDLPNFSARLRELHRKKQLPNLLRVWKPAEVESRY
jgi:hypothetical protein